MFAMISYFFYLSISIALTMFVGRTLHRNGRVFLLDSFEKDPDKADAVNNLLLVGFYLVNFGIVCLFLKYGTKPESPIESIEYLAQKLGVVLFVLGIMHYFNMHNIAKMRSKAMKKQNANMAAPAQAQV